jgi:hypothetical protein
LRTLTEREQFFPNSLDLARFASFLHARVSGLGRLCCKFLGNAKSVHGMFQRPFAQFVSSQVISLVVSDRSGLVSVNRKVVQL